MKPVDEMKEKVVLRAMSQDEEGKKRVEKRELRTHNMDTVKYVEKKLMDKGVVRMDRHPVDGKGGIGKPPPKSGHGGKYTWEGPDDYVENELDAAPPAIDEKDPNYVDEKGEEKILKGEEADVAGLVVGEIEVPKVVEERESVARVEVDPRLKDAVDLHGPYFVKFTGPKGNRNKDVQINVGMKKLMELPKIRVLAQDLVTYIRLGQTQ